MVWKTHFGPLAQAGRWCETTTTATAPASQADYAGSSLKLHDTNQSMHMLHMSPWVLEIVFCLVNRTNLHHKFEGLDRLNASLRHLAQHPWVLSAAAKLRFQGLGLEFIEVLRSTFCVIMARIRRRLVGWRAWTAKAWPQITSKFKMHFWIGYESMSLKGRARLKPSNLKPLSVESCCFFIVGRLSFRSETELDIVSCFLRWWASLA